MEYKALKKMDILELLKRQEMLDQKFMQKMCMTELDLDDIETAYFDEVGELMHELKPAWCYWKLSNKEIDRRKVLEELSDVFHFILQFENNYNKQYKTDEIINTHLINNSFVLKEKPELNYKLAIQEIKKLHKPKPLMCFILTTMLDILKYLNCTTEEFLQIHHEVWERNMNIRTKDNY